MTLRDILMASVSAQTCDAFEMRAAGDEDFDFRVEQLAAIGGRVGMQQACATARGVCRFVTVDVREEGRTVWIVVRTYNTAHQVGAVYTERAA